MTKSQGINRIAWLSTTLMIFTFVIFDMQTWGKYAFLLFSVILLILYGVSNKGKIKLQLGAYHYFMIAFSLYTALSSVWALSSSDAIIMARTLFRITVCYYPIYIYYKEYGNVEQLINCIKWAGYLIAIYALVFYGIDNLMLASRIRSYRMQNDFANANHIGLACAVTLLLQLWQTIIKKEINLSIFFAIPTTIVIGATQSRKALMFIILGFISFMILRGRIGKNINFGTRILKIIIGIVISILLINILSYIPVFSAALERLSMSASPITGSGVVDTSTIERNIFRSIGFEGWKSSPIVGVGIGCPHILSYRAIGNNAYLHDNYIEILCGGGIVGITLYYSMYLYAIRKTLKYRYNNIALSTLVIVLLFLLLLMDYGMVSYYSKSNCFYIMTIFLGLGELKKTACIE